MSQDRPPEFKMPKEILDLSRLREDLYVVYYDKKDNAVHLDIKADAINRLANSNPTLIPLLIKTLATATQMMSEDYLLMLQAAMEGKKKGGIHITDALPKPS